MAEERFSLESITKAAETIRPLVLRTPCVISPELSLVFRRRVYLKLENLQHTGAFKIRGNAYKLSKMTARQLSRGVVTASSGNHGLGLSLSARRLSAAARVVVPARTPVNKIRKMEGYGAAVVVKGDSYDEAVAEALGISGRTGAFYVPSFDDPDIITGNATMGLEIAEQVPDAEAVICPVGGGGGISGIGLALKFLAPSARLIGAQAEGASSFLRSLEKGAITELEELNTAAEGIAVGKPGEWTFPLVRELSEEVVSVSDPEIREALLYLLEKSRVLAEMAGAVSVAALGKIRKLPPEGSAVVCLVSGGNIDAEALRDIIDGDRGRMPFPAG